MSEKEMINNFVDTKDAEEAQLTIDCAIENLRLEVEINELKKCQKENLADAKSNGVAVKQVKAAITKLKKMAKQNPLEAEEEDFLVEKFQENIDISMFINELTKKD